MGFKVKFKVKYSIKLKVQFGVKYQDSGSDLGIISRCVLKKQFKNYIFKFWSGVCGRRRVGVKTGFK
jgi:hypothetical protein